MTHAVLHAVLIAAVASSTPLQSAARRPAERAEEGRAREPVEAFYAAFNSHGFDRAADFATEDWVHINPFGGWTRGRDAVIADLRRVHATFLKGVTDTPDEMEVRFAHPEAAVVTVTSRVSRYVLPDGSVHDDERQIRTFVVVKLQGRWRIMQDHNTIRR